MNQTILITGASKGVGLALAGKFLNEGFTVFAGIYHPAEALEKQAETFPGRLHIIPQNVADMDSVRNSAKQVASLTPHLDILINCAGVNSHKAMLPLPELDLTDGHLQAMMEVNAFGPLRVTQAFLPLLQQGCLKCIVNITSESGSIGGCSRDAWFGYCMSKAAANIQTQILHRYLNPQGFKVLAIHPGWVRTEMGGPDAHISAGESADGIFNVTMKSKAAGEAIYVDYTGEALLW